MNGCFNVKNIFCIFLFLNLLFLNNSYSQKYNSVDSIVLKYPKHFKTTKQLADQIQKDFSSEYDKSRAIYTWMALNIIYDTKALLHPKPLKAIVYKTALEKDLKFQEVKNNTINKVFRKKRGVCEGYSLLFQHLATLAGLKSQVINGMAKTTAVDIGRRKAIMNHAWNTVMIDGKWRLVDVTWGAGAVINKQNLWVKNFTPFYFDTPSTYFFTKHLPDSGVWETEILEEEEFLKAPLLYDFFFTEGYEIIEPKSGIITAVDNQKITFKIKNLSRFDKVSCINNRDKPIKVNYGKEDNDVLVFDVVYHKKDGRLLTLFVSGNAIAAFKIIPKSSISIP